MVERSLSMREVRGSMPLSSTFRFSFQFSEARDSQHLIFIICVFLHSEFELLHRRVALLAILLNEGNANQSDSSRRRTKYREELLSTFRWRSARSA